MTIKGVGPYAAANLLMILGRHDFIPIDLYALKMVSHEWYNGKPVTAKKWRRALRKMGRVQRSRLLVLGLEVQWRLNVRSIINNRWQAHRVFAQRLTRNGLIGLALLGFSLGMGMLGITFSKTFHGSIPCSMLP